MKVNDNIDLTYLLEKINIYKTNTILKNNIKDICIQENLLHKYINFTYSTEEKCNYLSITNKFFPIFNLNRYINYKFPKFINNLQLNNSILNLDIIFQLLYLKKNTLNTSQKYINSTNKLLTIDLQSIEKTFELTTSVTNIYIINPLLSIILNLYRYSKYLYTIYIPTHNLINNFNIILVSGKFVSAVKYLKLPISLIRGGEIITTGHCDTKLLAFHYNNSMLYTVSIYRSSKNTQIYIYNIILESLLKQYKYQGIILPSFLFEIVLKRMVSYVKVYYSGDSSLYLNDILSLTLVNLLNKGLLTHGFTPILYSPVVLGISRISISQSGVLSSLSFQNTLKSLSNLILDNKVDWLLDLKSRIIVSDLINTGTGWYKHYN
uniref:RNA polymerase C-subunit C2B n=1 Tax=Hepatozoon canis TaxID=110120 RepID=A0A3Q8THL8_9APIC|nr:RNA polymerase C - subunit C2B [Hepatozoon canis]